MISETVKELSYIDKQTQDAPTNRHHWKQLASLLYRRAGSKAIHIQKIQHKILYK